MKKILMLPGDGIGPEITAAAESVLERLVTRCGLEVGWDYGLIGGAAIDAAGEPLPPETLARARQADATLLAAVGGPKWDGIERPKRPERGLLAIRSELGLFCNLRPITVHPPLAGASSLKPELVEGLDVMIVRELVSGIYFGQPRGIETDADGVRTGFNTLRYTEPEIERVARLAFEFAQRRGGRLCSVDKANVLEVSELWREVVTRVGAEFPEVALTHMYVDNAAMQLVKAPKQFDVMLTTNLFGDILSDLASMLTGSIGMLPSASLNERRAGLYEPVHGSAPDIAGQNLANPLAMIASLAMALRYSLDEPDAATILERAIDRTLEDGFRTGDIDEPGRRRVGTVEMGERVAERLE